MVFLHLAISWAFMLSYDKSVKMNESLKNIIKYMNENFPEWKNSKHYKISHCFPKGFKFICIWGVHLFYRLHLPIVFIWVNRFLMDIVKLEVKW